MELIQFEGRTVAVIAPEDLEALKHHADELTRLLRAKHWGDRRCPDPYCHVCAALCKNLEGMLS